uniref:Protein ORF24 n=1 Tax=Cyprinid herpesvirus 2 TaxID=317878 RepID=A0A6H0QX62_CYHV2
MMTSDHYENLEKTYRAATGVLNDMVERDIAVLKNLKDITDQCAGGNLPRVRAQLLLKLTVALQRDHSSRWTDKLRGPTPESNAEFIKRLKNHSLDLDTLSCMNYYNPIYRAVPSQLHAAMHYARDTIAMERIKGIVDNGLDTVVEIDMRAARDRPTGGRVYSAKVILECPWATPELTGLRRLLYHVYQYLREDMTYEGLHNRVNADVVRIKMSNLVRHRLHLEIDVWVAPEAECYLRKIWDHSTYDKVTLAQEHISTFTAVSIKIDGVYRCSMPCEIDSDGTVVMYGTLAQGQCPVCNEIRDTKMLIHRSVHSEHDESFPRVPTRRCI